jgi:hypothetical protein
VFMGRAGDLIGNIVLELRFANTVTYFDESE